MIRKKKREIIFLFIISLFPFAQLTSGVYTDCSMVGEWVCYGPKVTGEFSSHNYPRSQVYWWLDLGLPSDPNETLWSYSIKIYRGATIPRKTFEVAYDSTNPVTEDTQAFDKEATDLEIRIEANLDNYGTGSSLYVRFDVCGTKRSSFRMEYIILSILCIGIVIVFKKDRVTKQK